ncbi:MAG: protein-L-isoaspartate O-methyltransferase [gamma proteobacterium symbiont of Phacoides pectinatus]
MAAANLERARFNMVHQQVRPWEVIDPRTIEVLETLPREDFVPEGLEGVAYADTEIPIGEGQFMMAPKIEGRLLQALDVQPGEQVLEIGTGSGYLSACLARMGGRVTSLEIDGQLCEQARGRLQALGISGVDVQCGDGLAHQAPATYDAIAVTGSLPLMSEGLKAMLKVGGRMFVVSGEGDGEAMQASLITRVGEEAWRDEALFETALTPLRNAPRAERFKF